MLQFRSWRSRRVLAFLGLIALPACTSMGRKSYETIVQKSALVAPDWVREEGPMVTPKEVYLHYIKEDATRLELGIRQANAAAIEDTKRLFGVRVRAELGKEAESVLGRRAKDIALQLDGAVSAATAQASVPDAQPRSVYWEEIQRVSDDGTRNSFRIHVLVTVPRNELDVALDAAARRLAASDNADAKKLGNEITKRFQAGQTESSE